MRNVRAIFLVAVLVACRGAAPVPASPEGDPARPLAPYAPRRVIVLPLQSLDDGAGWNREGAHAASRGRLDDEIAFALTERGLGSRWILPGALRSMTRRAGTYVPDLQALSVEPLRRRRDLPKGPLGDPLAGQLRSLVAFTDARWVLLPIEGRIERPAGQSAGPARLVVQLAMIDARGAVVAWMGDVAGDTASTPGPRPFATAAARVADLVAPTP